MPRTASGGDTLRCGRRRAELLTAARRGWGKARAALTPLAANAAATVFAGTKPPTPCADPSLPSLAKTDANTELVVAGASNRDVAVRRWHGGGGASVYRRLGMRSRSELARMRAGR